MTKTALILGTITLGLVSGLTGCVVTPEADPYKNIKIVESDNVLPCKLIGNLSSSSIAPYGLFSGTAHESVIDLAKKEGHKLGATHLVLNAPMTAGDTVSLNGKAYICQ